jgi:hypothetical protein
MRLTSFASALQQGFAAWWIMAESPLAGILTSRKKRSEMKNMTNCTESEVTKNGKERTDAVAVFLAKRSDVTKSCPRSKCWVGVPVSADRKQ